MSNKFADPTFGLNNQALAVLAFMANEEPTFAPYNKEWYEYECDIKTYPLYNGREQGICFVVRRGTIGTHGEDALHIFVAEHRNSDGIFVWAWDAPAPFNAPTLVQGDYGDETYQARKTFDFGRLDEVRQHIFALCEDYFARMAAPKVIKARRPKQLPSAQKD